MRIKWKYYSVLKMGQYFYICWKFFNVRKQFKKWKWPCEAPEGPETAETFFNAMVLQEPSQGRRGYGKDVNKCQP